MLNWRAAWLRASRMSRSLQPMSRAWSISAALRELESTRAFRIRRSNRLSRSGKGAFSGSRRAAGHLLRGPARHLNQHAGVHVHAIGTLGAGGYQQTNQGLEREGQARMVHVITDELPLLPQPKRVAAQHAERVGHKADARLHLGEDFLHFAVQGCLIV